MSRLSSAYGSVRGGDDADAAEDYHAAVVGGIFGRFHIVLPDDTERSLVAASDGIHLMTAQSTMEKQSSIGIYITDGNRIGIASVAQQGQRARRCLLQKGDAVGIRHLLALAPHGSELHFQEIVLSPIIDAISVVRKNTLQNVAGSRNTKIPTNTAPTAPIPVHTG